VGSGKIRTNAVRPPKIASNAIRTRHIGFTQRVGNGWRASVRNASGGDVSIFAEAYCLAE
jgi:hypothetical protein